MQLWQTRAMQGNAEYAPGGTDRSLKNRAKGSPYLGIKEERGIRVDFLA